MRTILLLSLILLSSCVTRKKCNAKFPPEIKTETVIENHYKETIRDSIIKGATVRDTIFINSTIPYEVNRWHYIRDTNGLATLRWKINELGQIITDCRAENKTVKIKDKQTISTNTTNSKESRLDPKLTWYGWLIIIILCGLYIYERFFRKKLNRY